MIEILVSDNASGDGTGEYIKSISKLPKYSNLIAWTNETNIGAVRNVKKLIASATGKYIFMLTDDDYLMPNALLILDRYLNKGYSFIKAALVINLIRSKQCSYLGTKTDVSDSVNHDKFIEIMSFSHALSGCIVKNSKHLLDVLENSNNAYPSLEMCALSAGKCISIAEPIVFHQWENILYWEKDVDMTSEQSRKGQLNRDTQLAMMHLADGFLNEEQVLHLYRYYLSQYGYIESALINKFKVPAKAEISKFNRKLFTRDISSKAKFLAKSAVKALAMQNLIKKIWLNAIRIYRDRFDIYKKKVALKRELSHLPSKRVIVGSGGTKYEGWANTDQDILNLLVESDWLAFFKPNSLDAILAEHVWEHLTAEQAVIAAENCFKYLKPGAYLRVAVPDGYHPNEEYLNWVKPGGIGPGSDDHKALYSHETFSNLFSSAGFNVSIYEYFDKSGIFHENKWDPKDGMIYRSKRFDSRNANGHPNYTSIILDAIKPVARVS